MKTSLYAIFIILAFLYIAKISIQLNPFKLSFERPFFAVGWFLITVGILMIQYQSEKKGFRDCENKIIELLEEKSNTK